MTLEQIVSEAWLPRIDQFMRSLASPASATDPLGGMIEEHLGTGGKRLRALLALAILRDMGGSAEKGLPWAAACELLHNATLIHDDLQDGDEKRRGAPTVWVRHGAAQAINAGDLMLMLPFLAVGHLDVAAEVKFQLMKALASHCEQTVRGQALEPLLHPNLQSAQLKDLYLDCIGKKTSALFQLPVEGAALIAGESGEEAAALSRAFAPLGTLFQIQDDVLDLFGSKGRDVVGADIQEGKISALVVQHLHSFPDEALWLSQILRKPRAETTLEEILSVRNRFEVSGTLEATVENMAGLVQKITSSDVLRRRPRLLAIAQELLLRILQPIAPVVSEGKVQKWLELS